MKIVSVIFLCLFFGFSIFAQTDKVGIETISLWRVGADGATNEETEGFLTNDKPLLFCVKLNSLKPTTVKMLLVAVDVKGIKPETKSVTISFTTNGKQNIVNFRANPEGSWLAGKYRADIYINNKLAANKEFMIEKPPSQNENETVPKPNSKPRTARRIRKN
ncbi:MAG TPA: hypothetical protein PKE69_24605 [Pyrinomonadaceae bacterium]|nr:hypothetical protein [Pyrinomonadaceae bacterium]